MPKFRLPETETEYRNALVDAAELGAQKLAIHIGLIEPSVSTREAGKQHGTWVISGLINKRLLKRIKDGMNTSKAKIDRVELEATMKATFNDHFRK